MVARMKALAVGMTPALWVERFEMKFAAVLVVLSVIGQPMPSQAEGTEDSVRTLVADCDDDGYGLEYCYGMMGGVSGAMIANCGDYRNGQGGNLRTAADATGHSYAAMRQSFRNWAAANPDMWGLPAATGVMLALRETFPCE